MLTGENVRRNTSIHMVTLPSPAKAYVSVEAPSDPATVV